MTNDVAPAPAGPGKNNPGEVSPSIPRPPGPRVLKIELRPDDGKSLKAFADVQLADGTIIRAFRVIEQPGKRVIVHCPQTCVKVNGKSAFFKTLVILPDPVKGDVDLAILYAWRQALGRQKGNGNGRLGFNTPKNM